ncbi:MULTISPECIES: YihY/virulence factor BrkB family protein [unclassified Saccharopolyspora]|uniref:YihY/virulence factor BrkB family protein n=1 Tax=unclassified Saccharopolyspora TaxID=2646250 RepID=UPI001CD67DF5|nr:MULTISPECIES: YihY/virulence factor BrkB family protein [unclassified Saccharopolyspora]MCA1187237.1 YihY/virulence factor BrkB family protein [Saccharopolyspora sp. 6T]MCA1193682.1 YihY/virulence factor BrkB family protein [Saccharopolyspora sp. 6V]MCA1283556.1 YihY/virulence factor BrkB family protein [Saccharopolyspora sp. 7B]
MLTPQRTLVDRIWHGQPRNRQLRGLWRLTKKTIGASARHRLTGLAGEAAFFTLISMPPVLLGLVGTLGYLAGVLGGETITAVRNALVSGAATVLSPQAIDELLQPVLDEVLSSGRAGVISIGFVLALWSGSAALNVFIDTISVVYGLAGQRNVVRQRLMSVLLYTVALFGGIVLLPLLAVGPSVIADWFPQASVVVYALYWPVIVIGSIASLCTLYSLSLPLRAPWLEHLPGAALALLVWLGGSLALRIYLDVTIEHSPVYGALAAPMGVLLWLYVTAFAVLLGGTVNAELDSVQPSRRTARLRRELVGSE